MDQPEPTPLKVTAARFLGSVRIFTGSEVGTKAKFLFAGLIALLCGLSALNVVNNYFGRNFMTAIAERQTSEFIRQAIFYICVFSALTVVGVIARFTEERLALRNYSPDGRAGAEMGSRVPPRVSLMASKAPMVRRRAVSMTDRTSA